MLSRALGSEPSPFRDIWPTILEGCHITKWDLSKEIWRLGRTGALIIEGASPRDRSLKEHHRLRAGKGIPAD
jgi:hypothetical protein